MDDKEYEMHVRSGESLRDAMEGPVIENRKEHSQEKDGCCGSCSCGKDDTNAMSRG